MKKKAKSQKINQIKAEQYDENEELDVEIEIEDDYYEDESPAEEIVVENDNFSTITNHDDEEDTEVYEDAKKTFKRINSTKLNKIFNIIFILLIVIIIIISIDVICVARYNTGPFFAIKTNTYKDGGTEVYYGLGYKVIKYKEIFGRRDTQIGFWSMQYSTTPTTIQDIDLAIEFQNDPETTSKKYYKKYLSISSEIKNISTKKNQMILNYQDPDGKYTLEINCSMATENSELTNYSENQKISVLGTVKEFTLKDGDKPNKVYISDCFAITNKE